MDDSKIIDVYLETGGKKTFAGAIEWPGWCRSGHGEAPALQALLDYGPRYQKVLEQGGVRFQAPEDISAFNITERLEGTRTTDFGAPDIPPLRDAKPVSATELSRFQEILRGCWHAFDAALAATEGIELRKGPRGGGRDQDRILWHVLGADAAYLRKLGWKFKEGEQRDPGHELERTREAILEGLSASVHGEIPPTGPRGGAHWTPRYFVRRVAWHVLDHAWEIEDRAK